MITVKVKYPSDAERMTGWSVFCNHFSVPDNACRWAANVTRIIEKERGNGWPIVYTVNGRQVDRLDEIFLMFPY